MHIKWEFMGTPTIFKRNYAIDYVVVNSNGRRNSQQNTIKIIKLKRVKELLNSRASFVVDVKDINQL